MVGPIRQAVSSVGYGLIYIYVKTKCNFFCPERLTHMDPKRSKQYEPTPFQFLR